MSGQPPGEVGRVPWFATVLWLMSTAVVAVVGTVLLDRSQVGSGLSVASWCLLILVAEVVLYLLVLTVGSAGRIGAGRAFAGTLVGLIVRAAASLIAAQVAVPAQVSTGGLVGSFTYFYLLYWPGILVQVCAVTIFLWTLRETWSSSLADDFYVPAQPDVRAEESGSRIERQRELLAALREADVEEEAEVAGEVQSAGDSRRGQLDAGFYEDMDSGESLPLPFEEGDSEPPGVIVAVGPAEDESPDDTSLIPVVAPEAEVEPLAEPDVVEQAEERAEQILPGVGASGLAPFAGGVLVWGGEQSLGDTELASAVGVLLAGAQALAQAAGAGVVQLLVIEAAGGCWALAADPSRDGWWVGLAQAGPVNVGRAVVSVRRAVVSLADAELAAEDSCPGPPPVAAVECLQGAVAHPLANPLLEQWGLTMTRGEIDDWAILVAAPAGRDRAGLASAGLQTWQAACRLAEVTEWREAQVVLVGAEQGAAAVGMASWEGEPALLAATGRETIQVAGVKVLLTKLADKLRDYGPRHRPGQNARGES